MKNSTSHARKDTSVGTVQWGSSGLDIMLSMAPRKNNHFFICVSERQEASKPFTTYISHLESFED